MVASAYHFFCALYDTRRSLRGAKHSLDEHGTWKDALISCTNRDSFPDVILKVNDRNRTFPGGEMIEIKEAQSYNIPSFNSTLPSRVKDIREVARKDGKMYREMRDNEEGKDPHRLQQREVYYLLSGRKGGNVKICLLHGAFFDTLPVDAHIRKMFEQVLSDALKDNPKAHKDPAFAEAAEKLLQLRWQQAHFNKTRTVDGASIKMRLRLMAEVHTKANIFNAVHFPEIADNTLNMIVPQDAAAKARMKKAFPKDKLPPEMGVLSIRNFLAQEFAVFQVPL